MNKSALDKAVSPFQRSKIAPLRKPRRRSSSGYTQRAVTLCIAVKCREWNNGILEPRVACCFDAQVGNDYEYSESEYKWSEISAHVTAMYSGPTVAAKDILIAYKRKLARKKLTVENYRDALWGPMQVFVDAETRRSSFQLEPNEVKLLIVAAVEGDFRLVTVGPHGITEHQYHAAIGSGEDSATAMLRWRGPTATSDLQEGMYAAYEAKRLGERSPHVGKYTTFLNVLCPQYGLRYALSDDDLNELKQAFEKFGPQRFDWKWKLSSWPWPQITPLAQPSPQSPKAARKRQPPSPESPEGSGES